MAKSANSMIVFFFFLHKFTKQAQSVGRYKGKQTDSVTHALLLRMMNKPIGLTKKYKGQLSHNEGGSYTHIHTVREQGNEPNTTHSTTDLLSGGKGASLRAEGHR